jgi:hypothetical protein
MRRAHLFADIKYAYTRNSNLKIIGAMVKKDMSCSNETGIVNNIVDIQNLYPSVYGEGLLLFVKKENSI